MNREIGRTHLSLRDRSLAFLLFGFLFAAYLLVFTGRIQSSDGLAMFAAAESIARRGDVEISQLLWMGLQQGTFGPDGALYSRKGFGMTLLLVPLVWLARQMPAVGLVQAALLLNPLLTAWTGALLFRCCIRLGWSRFVAVVTGLAFGLATPAWPYAQTLFSDPVAAWGLFGGAYGLLSHQQTGRKRYLFLAGAAWGLAYLSRAVNLLTLPLFIGGLYWILAHWGERGAPDRQFDLRRPLRLVRHWIFFGTPVVLAGLVSLWWNWRRFGGLFESGYLEVEAFNGDWAFGIFGLLFSPARGLLWYAPVLLLAGAGVGWYWRRIRWLALLALGLAGLYVAVYGKWFMWHGGFSWGPRFLLPVVPFLALLTAPAWHRLLVENRWGRLGGGAGAFLLLLSLGVQWLGLLVPFGLVQNWLEATVQPLFARQTFTQPVYSPLLRQWAYVSPENIHFAWWQAGLSTDWLLFFLLLATVAAGARLLVHQVQTPSPETSGNLLYGVALLLVAGVLLLRAQVPLSGADTAGLAATIARQEAPADAILLLDPLETQAFANAYHGRLPTFGPADRAELKPMDASLLAALQQDYRRLWVISASPVPGQSGWEQALRQQAFLLAQEQTPLGQHRLALYAFPQAQPLTEAGAGIEFGQPPWVRLNGYGFTAQTRPGGELLVALEWESLRPVTTDYQVFVHFLNESGEKLAQRDGQPVLWTRPTSSWQPGEEIVDRYGLLLPPDLPPGTYSVVIGLYDGATGQRQPSSAGPQDYALELGPIVVQSE